MLSVLQLLVYIVHSSKDYLEKLKGFLRLYPMRAYVN